MWLFLAFLAIPLIEIGLFIQVGGAIGLWPTLVIVVLTAIAGTWLVRTQGVIALSNLQKSFSQLEDPSEPLAHGAMILLAGALLLTPGFFTDGFGFALLIPTFRRATFRFLKSRIQVRSFEMGGSHHPGQRAPDTGDTIDGEYEEVDHSKKSIDRPSGWTKH